MKFIKNIACLAIVLALLLTMAVGCNNGNSSTDGSNNPSNQNTPGGTNDAPDLQDQTPPATDEGNLEDPGDPTVAITLNGTGYTVSKSGYVSASGNVLTLTKAGTYRLSGTLTNAQIRVSVQKTELVHLILNGVNITNTSSAPLYIESADKVSIELAAGTENVLTDGGVYVFPEGEDKPNACLYSSEDLTIKGEGALKVNANYNNGIGTKNDLKIESGSITVIAVNNALKGNQSIKIEGGNVTIKGADGMKSDSLIEGEGYIRITGGKVYVTAGDDGLQAVTDITITTGAEVTVDAADKDLNCDGTTNVAEGTFLSK